MSTKVTNQLIQQIVSATVRNYVNGFLLERKSRGLSKWTIKYYSNELRYFSYRKVSSWMTMNACVFVSSKKMAELPTSRICSNKPETPSSSNPASK